MSLEAKNLLFIFSDQHSKEKLGCYGNLVVKTPNLDSLAARGVRFSQAYTNCPICVPARAALATGRYVHDLRLWDNAHPYIGGFPSWGHRMVERGVHVTTVGKLHFRKPEDPVGFPDQRLPLHCRDEVGDIYGSLRERDATKHGLCRSILDAHPGESSYTDFDRKVAQESARFLLDEAPKLEKPWALQVGFVLPHFPFFSPEEFWEMYKEDDLPFPKQYGLADRPMHPSCRDLRHYMGTEEELDKDAVMRAVHAYYGMCSFMDAQTGMVLDALQQSGLHDNTIVVYSTDHGEMLGDHGLWYKSSLYDGAASIPFIVAGPDIPAAKTVDTPISLIDGFQTFLDCVGVEPKEEDEDLPGMSVLPIARGEISPERTVFSEYHASGSLTGGYMLRRGNLKYIHYAGYPQQLFNLEDDPDELSDLAGKDAYHLEIERFEKELRSIVDPAAISNLAKADQTRMLDSHGGRGHVKTTYEPVIYSPASSSKTADDRK